MNESLFPYVSNQFTAFPVLFFLEKKGAKKVPLKGSTTKAPGLLQGVFS